MSYPFDCHKDLHEETGFEFICLRGKALFEGYVDLESMT